MAVTIISTVPANGATGVSPSASVVFTFSAPMNPGATTVSLIDTNAGEDSPVVATWNGNNTVFTCTPSPQFANGHTFEWQVSGQDAVGNFLSGTTSGAFTTVTGINGGSGTDGLTTFVVGEYSLYNQTSASPPVQVIYEFSAQTLLASNRTASAITLTMPTAAVSNLVPNPLTPEKFNLVVYNANQATFNATFPAGSYTFNVTGSPSQQQTVTLPADAQPNAPMVSNYTAAQAINPLQPFTLTWNTFSNGTSADWILLLVTLNPAFNFQTPFFGQPGALGGTATSFTIPAGTLQPNTNYNADLVFYHGTVTSNGSSVSEAFIATATGFNLSTTAGSTAPRLTLSRAGTNVAVFWPTNATGFALEFATNLVSPVWSSNLPASTVVSTNNVVTNAISGTKRFFRLVGP